MEKNSTCSFKRKTEDTFIYIHNVVNTVTHAVATKTYAIN